MHLGFEIKPNGFSRKTGGYLSSRDGVGGERLRRVAASGERRRGYGGRRRASGAWRVGRRGDAGGGAGRRRRGAAAARAVAAARVSGRLGLRAGLPRLACPRPVRPIVGSAFFSLGRKKYKINTKRTPKIPK